MQGLGAPAFRGMQVKEWLLKGVSFDKMNNLPLSLREKLKESFIDQPVRIVHTARSQKDDTQKMLFSLLDGTCVEGVLMRYRYGDTLCISTQVGCRMGCIFCASALDGCIRNLTAEEMLGQTVMAGTLLPEHGRVSRIVLMGSGEPLDNYDQVVRFLRLVSSKESLNIGLRNVSLSTCGLCEQMDRLANEGLPVTLSVSLHAPNDRIRRQIMPVAKTYPIEKLMVSCRNWVKKTGRRIVFEYALINGLNAGEACAKELASRLRGLQCHVNLIPLNDVKERDLQGVSAKQAKEFCAWLENLHISASIRRTMGEDIDGACGQLRACRLQQESFEEREG